MFNKYIYVTISYEEFISLSIVYNSSFKFSFRRIYIDMILNKSL